MRRIEDGGESRMGGAWHCAGKLRAEESESTGLLEAGARENTTGEKDTPCPEESCTKGPCTVGMSLQQF